MRRTNPVVAAALALGLAIGAAACEERGEEGALEETGEAIDTGVHGAIKAHYKLLNEKDLPLPVDYLVGATGA